MANKYETGTYIVNIYDKHGTRQHRETNIGTLVEAQDISKYLIETTDESSVILRVLNNSKD